MAGKIDVLRLIRDEKVIDKITKACGISRQAVYQWRAVPVEPHNRVFIVAKILKIPVSHVRPDIYPRRLFG